MKEEKKQVKTHQKLGEILVHYKIITPEQLEVKIKNLNKNIDETLDRMFKKKS